MKIMSVNNVILTLLLYRASDLQSWNKKKLAIEERAMNDLSKEYHERMDSLKKLDPKLASAYKLPSYYDYDKKLEQIGKSQLKYAEVDLKTTESPA